MAVRRYWVADNALLNPSATSCGTCKYSYTPDLKVTVRVMVSEFHSTPWILLDGVNEIFWIGIVAIVAVDDYNPIRSMKGP